MNAEMEKEHKERDTVKETRKNEHDEKHEMKARTETKSSES